MKKILLVLCMLSSLIYAIRIGDLELSPELGLGAKQLNEGGDRRYYWNGFARLWFGINELVLAPSFSYTKMNNDSAKFTNNQYGANLGYGLDLIALYAVPYVGLHYSNFNAYYDDTYSFDVGVRIKPIILPFSLALEYEWQRPRDRFGQKQTINGLRFSFGLSF